MVGFWGYLFLLSASDIWLCHIFCFIVICSFGFLIWRVLIKATNVIIPILIATQVSLIFKLTILFRSFPYLLVYMKIWTFGYGFVEHLRASSWVTCHVSPYRLFKILGLKGGTYRVVLPALRDRVAILRAGGQNPPLLIVQEHSRIVEDASSVVIREL